MTQPAQWHADAAALQAYATGGATDAVAWSIETHLPTCVECRQVLTRLLTAQDRNTLASAREALALQERSYARTPISAIVAGVLGPWWAWIGTLFVGIGVLLIADAWSGPGGSAPWAVGLAPLLPLALVATVYAAADRDAVTDASPRGGLEIALLRTGAVLALSIPCGILVLHPVGAAPGQLVVWLLPGLGLSLGALVLGTWAGVERAAQGLFVVWSMAVIAVFTPRFALHGGTWLVAPSGAGVVLWSCVVAGLLAWVIQHRVNSIPRSTR